MANEKLAKAQKNKNDEFYTQYRYIEKEMNAYLEFDPKVFRDKTVFLPCDDPEWSNFTKYFAQNFQKLGLRKLISTSYAADKKIVEMTSQPSLFESESPSYDPLKTRANGKIFTLQRDKTNDGHIDVDDLEWEYLRGDGDFRSPEIRAICDEADVIITNPPFSLFPEFLAWIIRSQKDFVIIGNINAIMYKETFAIIKDNKLWLGATNFNTGMYFKVPPDFVHTDTYNFVREENGEKVNRVPGVCWFTNLDHGRRHQPLALMTLAENLRFSKHKDIRGQGEYRTYENYDAIEVPLTASIPSDFLGVMGVPLTFLDKYNPDQFEILGMCENSDLYKLKTKIYTSAECKNAYESKFGKTGTYDLNAAGVVVKDGVLEKVYSRVLIRHRRVAK
jgi:hypothetical protein